MNLTLYCSVWENRSKESVGVHMYVCIHVFHIWRPITGFSATARIFLKGVGYQSWTDNSSTLSNYFETIIVIFLINTIILIILGQK